MFFNDTLISTQEEAFTAVSSFISKSSFTIVGQDLNRPWGGYFNIDESQADTFANKFFATLIYNKTLKLSPKFLILAPGKKISWQYHERRAELWNVALGPVGIFRSETENMGEITIFPSGSSCEIAPLERHRLVGLENWAVVAEVWLHTNKNNPSNEEDIIRLQDDYGR